jgi:hypothetical protein
MSQAPAVPASGPEGVSRIRCPPTIDASVADVRPA